MTNSVTENIGLPDPERYTHCLYVLVTYKPLQWALIAEGRRETPCVELYRSENRDLIVAAAAEMTRRLRVVRTLLNLT